MYVDRVKNKYNSLDEAGNSKWNTLRVSSDVSKMQSMMKKKQQAMLRNSTEYRTLNRSTRNKFRQAKEK